MSSRLRAFVRGFKHGYGPVYAAGRAARTLPASETSLGPVPGHRWYMGGWTGRLHAKSECGWIGPRRATFHDARDDGDAHIAHVLGFDP